MKTFEVCVLKSFDDFGSFAADGLTVKLACRHTKSARGRNYYFVGVFKLFESIVAFFYRYAFFVADFYKVLSGDTGQNEAVKLMGNELAVFYY